jgi:hypothetical protein
MAMIMKHPDKPYFNVHFKNETFLQTYPIKIMQNVFAALASRPESRFPDEFGGMAIVTRLPISFSEEMKLALRMIQAVMDPSGLQLQQVLVLSLAYYNHSHHCSCTRDIR